MSTDGTQVVRVCAASALCALAGLGFGPVFGGFPGPTQFVVAVAVAVAAGLVIGMAAVAWRRVSATVLAAGGMALVLGGCAIVAGPGGDVLHGPSQLLTGALPADASGSTLYAAAVLVGWATVASCLLAAYSRSPVPATAPPLACLVAGRALGSSATELPGWFLIVALALLVTLLAARRRPAVTGVIGVLALTGLVAATVATQAPGVGWREPLDARGLLTPPFAPLETDNPFQRYLAYRNGTIPLELAVTTSADVDRLRLVTLTDFDGQTWQPTASYRRAGKTLPVAPPSSLSASTVDQHVEIRTGTLGWLPTAGRPTRISVPDLGVDELTGDLAVPTDRGTPKSYEATSRVPHPQPEELTSAQPVPLTEPVTYHLPRATQLFLNTVIRDASPGTGQLLALWRQLARGGQFAYDESADAPGGHSLYSIERMFTSTEPRRGTGEQYASAYAVLARALGFQARVVLGFRRPGTASTSFTVTGRDIAAWAEVRFAGLGWVELDPSPVSNPIGTRPNKPAQPAHNPTSDPVDQAADDDRAQQAAPPAPAAPAGEPGWGSLWWRVAAIAAVALGSGVLVMLLSIPVVKTLRRRRRRAPSERAAIAGAWRESLDRLREVGLPAEPTQTSADVVALAHSHPRTGTTQAALRALGLLVDQARYAPEQPDPTSRSAAWSAADTVHMRLRRAQPPARRLVMLFDPRSLMR